MAVAPVGAANSSTYIKGASSPLTATLPSSPTADDFILIAAVCDATAGATITSSTYAQIGSNSVETVAAPDTNLAALYKIAAGADSSPSVAFSATNGNFCFSCLFSGVDTTTPLDGVAPVGSNLGVANADFTPTGVTTLTANACVISIVANQVEKGCVLETTQGFTAFASGAGYADLTGSDGSMGLAYKIVASPGAVTMPTWTTINGTDTALWAGLSFVLRESGASTFSIVRHLLNARRRRS